MVVRNVVRSPVRAVVQSVFGEGESFHPFQLFTSGAQGAWYDPSDFSTLYQDAAGTIPVTAVEQPVRLMLDRSRGLVLGSELRGSGTVSIAGTPPAASYNSSTGAGSIGRTDAANRSGVELAGLVSGGWYFVDIENLGSSTTSLALRAPLLSSAFLNNTPTVFPGQRVTCRVAMITSGGAQNVLVITDTGTAGQVNFILHSVRELPGNHALAPNDASRPVLRARYNRLIYSEDIGNAAWAKTGSSYAAGKLIEDVGGTFHRVRQTFSVISGETLTFSATVNGGERNLQLQLRDHLNTGREAFAIFNPTTGATVSTGGSTWVATATSVSLGGGAYRVTITTTVNVSGTIAADIALANNTTLSYSGDGTSGVFVDFVSLLTAADHAATGGAYQRVGAATDYDTGPPWRPYLAFDGSDDSMSTSSIDFSGTDKMTVFAGVSKLSDAALAALTELSASSAGSAGNSGAFAFFAPNPSNLYTWRSKGTTLQDVNTNDSTYSAPDTSVLTGIGDISGDVSTLRIDGVQVGTNTNDQGTGNFGNYPLFIGRRGDATLPFNGRLYSLAVLGRTATAPELTAMESWIAGKTGVSL